MLCQSVIFIQFVVNVHAVASRNTIGSMTRARKTERLTLPMPLPPVVVPPPPVVAAAASHTEGHSLGVPNSPFLCPHSQISLYVSVPLGIPGVPVQSTFLPAHSRDGPTLMTAVIWARIPKHEHLGW